MPPAARRVLGWPGAVAAFLLADEVLAAYALGGTHLRLFTARLATLLAIGLRPGADRQAPSVHSARIEGGRPLWTRSDPGGTCPVRAPRPTAGRRGR